MQAERLPNGKIRLFGNVWADEFEPERLPGWIKFYERMYADHDRIGYKKAADALKALPKGS